MDNKQLIMAIVLSIAVILAWQGFSKYMGWLPEISAPQEQQAAVTAPDQGKPAEPGASPAAGFDEPAKPEARPVFVPTGGRLVTVDTPLYRAVFHSNGGVLRSYELKQYHTTVAPGSPQVNLVSELAAGQAPLGLLVNGQSTWMDAAWALEGSDLSLDGEADGVLRFVGEAQGLRIVRELGFDASGYTIKENLRLEPLAGPTRVNLAFTFAATSLASDLQPGTIARLKHLVFGGPPPEPEESQYNITRVAWFQNQSFDEEMSPNSLAEGVAVKAQLHWMAVMNNYFMGAASMNDPKAEGKGRYAEGVYHARLGKTGVDVPAEGLDLECVYFIGPKEGKRLEAAPNYLAKALDYGFFSIVAKPLVWLLQFLYGFTGNYGWAIVMMTILIKILFWPLSQKSYKSMQQMKELQPMMAKIREKYAGDKEAMNREVMQLYKTYKVNPAGGCLPILVQLPVFFGLYQGLLNAIELRHAAFINTLPFTDKPWLMDLSAADPYWITPLVMGASMFLQQKMTPTPGDPTQAKVMLFMPIIFTLLFLGFPSGLVVYWLANNIISIGQQWWQMNRSPSAVAAGKAAKK